MTLIRKTVAFFGMFIGIVALVTAIIFLFFCLLYTLLSNFHPVVVLILVLFSGYIVDAIRALLAKLNGLSDKLSMLCKYIKNNYVNHGESYKGRFGVNSGFTEEVDEEFNPNVDEGFDPEVEVEFDPEVEVVEGCSLLEESRSEIERKKAIYDSVSGYDGQIYCPRCLSLYECIGGVENVYASKCPYCGKQHSPYPAEAKAEMIAQYGYMNNYNRAEFYASDYDTYRKINCELLRRHAGEVNWDIMG